MVNTSDRQSIIKFKRGTSSASLSDGEIYIDKTKKTITFNIDGENIDLVSSLTLESSVPNGISMGDTLSWDQTLLSWISTSLVTSKAGLPICQNPGSLTQSSLLVRTSKLNTNLSVYPHVWKVMNWSFGGSGSFAPFPYYGANVKIENNSLKLNSADMPGYARTVGFTASGNQVYFAIINISGMTVGNVRVSAVPYSYGEAQLEEPSCEFRPINFEILTPGLNQDHPTEGTYSSYSTSTFTNSGLHIAKFYIPSNMGGSAHLLIELTSDSLNRYFDGSIDFISIYRKDDLPLDHGIVTVCNDFSAGNFAEIKVYNGNIVFGERSMQSIDYENSGNNIIIGHGSLSCSPGLTSLYNTIIGNVSGNVNFSIGLSYLNTSIGYNCMTGYMIPVGSEFKENTAIGGFSQNNHAGSCNTSVGAWSLSSDGSNQEHRVHNLALGYCALRMNTSSYNIAIGSYAGAIYSGSNNLILGHTLSSNYLATTSSWNNCIYINLPITDDGSRYGNKTYYLNIGDVITGSLDPNSKHIKIETLLMVNGKLEVTSTALVQNLNAQMISGRMIAPSTKTPSGQDINGNNVYHYIPSIDPATGLIYAWQLPEGSGGNTSIVFDSLNLGDIVTVGVDGVPAGVQMAGTGTALTISRSDHDHDLTYAAIDHDHDLLYALISHNHNDLYALTSHNHNDLYSLQNHNHNLLDLVDVSKTESFSDGDLLIYRTKEIEGSKFYKIHNSIFAEAGHDHDNVYAQISHSHNYATLIHNHSISSLTDVNVSGLQDGYTLKWNLEFERWMPSALDTFSIVGTEGQFMYHDGNEWKGTDYIAIEEIANSDPIDYKVTINKILNLTNSFSISSSALITNLNADKVDGRDAGVANGLATLDENAKVPISQLPDGIGGGLNYLGSWNANANSPSLSMSSVPFPDSGSFYIVSVAGTWEGLSFLSGDWIISTGLTWEKISNSSAITSVFGRVGAISSAFGDYSSNLISHTYPLIPQGETLVQTDVRSELRYLRSYKLDESVYTASNVLTKLKTVDGTGSGLDADLLDGQHASSFANVSHKHSVADFSEFNNMNDGDLLYWDSGAGIVGYPSSYFSLATHNHNATYSLLGHTHSEYSLANHAHWGLLPVTVNGGATVYFNGSNWVANETLEVHPQENKVNVYSTLEMVNLFDSASSVIRATTPYSLTIDNVLYDTNDVHAVKMTIGYSEYIIKSGVLYTTGDFELQLNGSYLNGSNDITAHIYPIKTALTYTYSAPETRTAASNAASLIVNWKREDIFNKYGYSGCNLEVNGNARIETDLILNKWQCRDNNAPYKDSLLFVTSGGLGRDGNGSGDIGYKYPRGGFITAAKDIKIKKYSEHTEFDSMEMFSLSAEEITCDRLTTGYMTIQEELTLGMYECDTWDDTSYQHSIPFLIASSESTPTSAIIVAHPLFKYDLQTATLRTPNISITGNITVIDNNNDAKAGLDGQFVAGNFDLGAWVPTHTFKFRKGILVDIIPHEI